ncbi:MerR family transcriptional regulator [Beggiatoa leptomitoformis]|uniref:MerR family transcriptional regulator n=1 Tax=Beggiatoa leptomitoformis TaxID=288004 RepID=A0A2N9YID6_9GAMM|nr:MerR family DNA-binding transcriptional regulator [Beggiatoa leptomitoformis]ALG67513.1 MerR family transcriptional regulator [Beggiatoa leptomitoformis]AUI70264.1 MerR family transcriptional regulator [Beggiatoa leptomitoformis]
MSTQHFSISQLANEFNVTTRTIRFYEAEGLLAPRRQGQTRVYSTRERVRLKLILRGKRLGLSLREIREVLQIYDLEKDEVKQLHAFVDKIRNRRAILEQQRHDIEILLSELDKVEKQCLTALANNPHITAD